MKEVIQIFRSRRRARSIEKVFGALENYWTDDFRVIQFVARRGFSGLFDLLMLRFRNKGAIFHITGDWHWACLIFTGEKLILTVHDINRIKYLSPFKKGLYHLLYVEIPARTCKAITFVSEFSLQQFSNYSLKQTAQHIVIANSFYSYADHKQNPQIADPVKKPKLLFLGSDPNKNLNNIIKALSQISVPLHLTVVGSVSLQQSIELNALGSDSRVSLALCHDVAENELGSIYREHHILLFPSLEEGFGLPILEAQSAGLLVVTSNIEPMVTIGGDSCFYCDPVDPRDIMNAVFDAMTHLNHSASPIVQRGFANIERFAPQAIVQCYEEIYASV